MTMTRLYRIEILEPLEEGLQGFGWGAATPDGTAYCVNSNGDAGGFAGAYWPRGVTDAVWCEPSTEAGDTGSLANDINCEGVVAGKSSHGADTDPGGEQLTPRLWRTKLGNSPNAPVGEDLSGSPSTTANKTLSISINDAGVVLCRGVVSQNRALLRLANGTWSVLLPLSGGLGSTALRITERGDVCGTSLALGQVQTPVVWPSYGTACVALPMTSTLTNPTEGTSGCKAGNGKRQYVGKLKDLSAGEHLSQPGGVGTSPNHRAVLWANRSADPLALGVLESGLADAGTFSNSDPLAINDSTEVVGHCTDFGLTGTDADDLLRAFLWTRTHGMVLLQSLVQSMPSGAILLSALDISNNGYIVGACSHEGLTKGFRLTPLVG